MKMLKRFANIYRQIIALTVIPSYGNKTFWG